MITFLKNKLLNLSIQTQLISAVSIGSILVTFIFYYYFVNRQNVLFTEYFYKNNEALATTLQMSIELGASNEQYDALIPVFEWSRKDSAIHFIVLLDENKELIVNYPIDVELNIDSLLKNAKYSSPDDLIYLKLVKWKAKFGRGELLIGFSTYKYTRLKNEALINLSASLIIVLILSVIIFSFLALRITKPLKNLTNISSSIANGDVSKRADNDVGSIEIKTLADSFNLMLDNLLNSQKQRLREAKEFSESLELQNKELIELHSELEKYSNHLESIVAERTKELVSAMAEIEKSSKLKTEIMANMNHEIRTPLSFIKSSAALVKILIESKEPDYELIETLNYLNAGVNRLAKTLELFADLSQIKSGNFVTNKSYFNLKSSLDYVYLVYSKLIKEEQKNIEFSFNSSIEDAYVEADEQNVEKILMFITDNAVKFTIKGYVKISLCEIDDNKLRVIIEDSGIGISDDFQARIFEPFSQEDMSATRKFEGIGLSLALANEFCSINQVDLSFSSTKDVGTAFTLMFNKVNIDDI